MRENIRTTVLDLTERAVQSLPGLQLEV